MIGLEEQEAEYRALSVLKVVNERPDLGSLWVIAARLSFEPATNSGILPVDHRNKLERSPKID
jgi:hypothetical protein